MTIRSALRILCCTFMTLALFTVAGPVRAAAPDAIGTGPHLRIQLIAESARPAPGGMVTLALAATPDRGWHGYWLNPGDAGFPAKAEWTLPAGVTAGDLQYPPPGRLLVAGLMNYVYTAPYAMLVTLTLPAGLKPGTALPVRLHLAYLVCSDVVCVPETADLSAELTVGDGATDPATRARFDAWRRALPRPLAAAATYQVAGDALRIGIAYPAARPARDAYFYPLTTGLVNYAEPQAIGRDGDRLVVATKATGTGGGALTGVLVVDGQALAITARPGAVAAATTAAGPAGPAGGWLVPALIAFAGAVLGGLILNIMPCVFPILSLKALSLARAGDEASARGEGIAYTAGAVLVCLGLGAAILALRAGGSAVGWAFQLQDPRVVTLLLLLSVGIALNLAGVFELPVPGFAGKGSGRSGAFATGALAAFVATPCTGPFMGAALGAALILPAPAALAVFAGLGLGLALPFLLLGYIPVLRRRLPRPGMWMDTLRRILSIPMWLTAVALAWVLGRQIGVDGMTLALLVALGFGIVLWAAGRRQARGLGFGMPALAMLVLVAGGGVWLTAGARAGATAPPAGGDEAFSEARLADLRKQGRPVFAYFTADWCLTCKVNEQVAIDQPAVRDAFRRTDTAVLVGDWTSGDPTLGRFIEAHNRAGVPLYLYYPAGGGAPRVLPQVLTPGTLTALK